MRIRRTAPAAIVMLLVLATVGHTANRALQLEGDPDSAFEAPDHASFDADLGSALTMEAWVHPALDTGELMIVNKEDVYEFATVSGIAQVAIQPAGAAWAWMNSALAVPADEWSHVAVTYDGVETRMFVNGEAGPADPGFQGDLNDSPDTFKVGRRSRGGATHSAYTGLIDEVRISNSIRYTDDFDPQTEAFDPDDDTVALYHFDDETGGTVRDFSKLRNDGELVNVASLVEVELPNTVLAVGSPDGKAAVTWAAVKRRVTDSPRP